MTIAAAAMVAAAGADTIAVKNFRYAGPFIINTPAIIDSVDVNSRKFEAKRVLDMPVNIERAMSGATVFDGTVVKGVEGAAASHLLGFNMTNTGYTTAQISVEGLENYRLYVDGKQTEPGAVTLKPADHSVVVRYVSSPGAADTADIRIIAPDGQVFQTGTGERMFTLDNVLHGRRIYSTSMSPDGKYLITVYSNTLPGGATSWEWVVSTAGGAPVARSAESLAWMPTGSRYYRTTGSAGGRSIRVTDAATGVESVFADGVPAGHFTISPDEKFLVMTLTAEGHKENPEVYRIIEPDDRQPGWRNRRSLAVYDIATGVLSPITYGHHNVSLLDISDDATKALVMSSRSRLEKRPTTMHTLAVLDFASLSLDTIVADDGFLAGAVFSPDASTVIVSGSPEALGGIGKNVPEGRIPSMIDTQLFEYNVKSRSFRPLTKNFNPNVTAFQWSRADGKVYFTAEDRDCISAFRLDPLSGNIERLPLGQDIIKGISLPLSGTGAAFVAQSVDNPDRLYALNTKSLKTTVLDEPLADDMKEIRLGATGAWDFVNSRGDTICGRFYLPPNFDADKKYPLIVNYYGGCSPTSRNFESRYPHHAYAAQGYVVYVVEPSGATGFGQEFSSRHVKTAGQGVAEDIIEGTKRFCEEHPYVDSSKIGCIGASYGGFMTQYLQTVTDIFAAAISHAGISDHTSYWGEGYWGYSYSEVSMGDAYPWSDAELYVKQSPLYNADKIHTPLLFLHDDKDMNVPVGESIQMFTALKLLNRPTAFVAVADQDHHITDYQKRIRWQDTIFAWFAKYLKGEPQWWEAMYPEVAL